MVPSNSDSPILSTKPLASLYRCRLLMWSAIPGVTEFAAISNLLWPNKKWLQVNREATWSVT